jgi:putative hydrolase of the HAD superfamily
MFTDNHGRENWKPSPEPFRRIAEALASPAAACAYVGDNPAKDFVAPNRLGWLTVHLQREGGEYRGIAPDELPQDHRARHEIGSLRELEGILS